MEIIPKAMEIEYIRIKRFNQKTEKAYATGLEMRYVHIPEHTRSLSGSLLGYKTIP